MDDRNTHWEGRYHSRLRFTSHQRELLLAGNLRLIVLCEAKGIPILKDARILDYGCGAGRHVYDLLDAGYSHAVGYDVVDYLALRDPADRTRFSMGTDGHGP